MLRIWKTERKVGGYELSDITFYFRDGVLAGGEYELPSERREQAIPDLIEKYTEVYGEPTLHKEAVSPYREELSLWLWIDADENYVFLDSYFGTILYGTPDPVMLDYVDRFSEEGILGEWFHVSIQDEIGRIGNLDGI